MVREKPRQDLFDHWSGNYDRDVQGSVLGFPFAGYGEVLDEVVTRAAVVPGHRVLDIGSGTGNLAERFVSLGCQVVGVDYSVGMIHQAQAKIPQAQFVHADILRSLPESLNIRYDRIVSGYVFHEFSLDEKLHLLQRLAINNLHPDGKLVIGDIGFQTVSRRSEALEQVGALWDEDEYYWAADEVSARLEELCLKMEYVQVSPFAGVYTFTPCA